MIGMLVMCVCLSVFHVSMFLYAFYVYICIGIACVSECVLCVHVFICVLCVYFYRDNMTCASLEIKIEHHHKQQQTSVILRFVSNLKLSWFLSVIVLNCVCRSVQTVKVIFAMLHSGCVLFAYTLGKRG